MPVPSPDSISKNASVRSDSDMQDLLREHDLTPMEAVNVLYSEGKEELSDAIITSLSHQVFDEKEPQKSGAFRRFLAKGVFRLIKKRTRTEYREGPDGEEVVVYRNRLLEKSGHPYAETLLSPSVANTSDFVEGGDPMNAPYMMICPRIRRNADTWDRLLLDSVHARDVQLRFIWETRSTYEAARLRLNDGKPVRIKAAASGTGLSAILVFDRLIRDGHDPESILVVMTDREESNVRKARCLLEKLANTRGNLAGPEEHFGITSRTMDLLHDIPSQMIKGGHGLYHIMTLVGILEYFRGFTCATTEEFQGDDLPGDESEATELIRKIGEMTTDSGIMIANSYRPETAARIIEIFGKKLRYRNLTELRKLAASGGFSPLKTTGSGNVYDVETFEKRSTEDDR